LTVVVKRPFDDQKRFLSGRGKGTLFLKKSYPRNLDLKKHLTLYGSDVSSGNIRRYQSARKCFKKT